MERKLSVQSLRRSISLLVFLSACATTPMGGPDDPGGNGDADGGGGGVRDLRFDSDAFWAADPPPKMCALDGNFEPPKVPGGTPECPDDKNREGCSCPSAGMTAPCWPGLRVNRNLGICKDGTTTCQAGEVQNTWSTCNGFVLPAPGATSGAQACQCFSAGQWKLDNLVPCFYNRAGGQVGDIGATSSVIQGGQPTCLAAMDPPTLPTQPWSPDTVNVDCSGRFNLCYSLKAGKASDPKATDCEIVKVCTSPADYTKAGMTQPFPVLPPWRANSAAAIQCSIQFAATGGYGEMSVDGLSVTCDKVGPKVFNRVQYCPLKCNDPNNKNLPECQMCGSGGSGSF